MLQKRTLDGAALKWIALISMLLDHIGYVLVAAWIRASGRTAALTALYYGLRGVGRLAFPIFCFLLVEGFVHTRSRAKYLLRLLAFALVSEIPYDLAFRRTLFYLGKQNVFFTLVLGLLAVWAWQTLIEGKNERGFSLWRAAGACLAACGATAAAHFLHSDYGIYGVLLILAFYPAREEPWLRDLCAALVLAAMVFLGGVWKPELFGLLALPLLHCYSGERGRQSKWFFYVFYPGHLLLLYLLHRLIWGS
ncbi:MAG: hypothetical protein IJI27_04985 [Oscillospiraceae bacterium]|nr:hypothetical protein [Oscillospiraceae bacterium]